MSGSAGAGDAKPPTGGRGLAARLRALHPVVFWPVALALSVLLACLLAAPTHDLLMSWGLLEAYPSDHPEYTRYFLKVFRRLLLLPLAVLLLWRVRPWRGRGALYGLREWRQRWPIAVAGCLGIAAVLVAVLAWQFQRGWLTFEDPLRWGEFAWRVAKYLVAGFLIGVVEELFFRGWLTDQFRRLHSLPVSIFWSAVTYALLHAFRPRGSSEGITHDAAGALEALLSWARFIGTQQFCQAAIGLFCFALLCTAAFRRWGGVWGSLGIHAGAVWVLYSYGALTHRGAQPAWSGTRLLYDSPLVWVLLLLGAWVLRPRADRGATSTGPAG